MGLVLLRSYAEYVQGVEKVWEEREYPKEKYQYRILMGCVLAVYYVLREIYEFNDGAAQDREVPAREVGL